MKIQTTSKNLKERYILINCCQAPNNFLNALKQHSETTYYNAGVYGWNYDVYIFGRYALIQGYRTFKGDYEGNFEEMKNFKKDATKEDIEQFIQNTINNK